MKDVIRWEVWLILKTVAESRPRCVTVPQVYPKLYVQSKRIPTEMIINYPKLFRRFLPDHEEFRSKSSVRTKNYAQVQEVHAHRKLSGHPYTSKFRIHHLVWTNRSFRKEKNSYYRRQHCEYIPYQVNTDPVLGQARLTSSCEKERKMTDID